MKTVTQILPGVKSIGWVDCSRLADRVALHAICRMPVPIFTEIHPIEFFDDPQCECKTTKDGGDYHDAASLKFLAAEQLPYGTTFGFIVTDVNDKSYLIGSKESPFPITTCERKAGTPDGDAAGYYYEITHVALKSLIPCVI